MPVRLLREGILDSDAVCSLTFPAEVFYRRLMSVVDDFGRFDGRVSVLRSRLYALQIDKVREADITRWVAECAKAGLIALYSVSGKPYILFHKLGEPRAKESKYPDPPPGFADANGRAQTQTSESSRAQPRADVPPSYSPSDTDSPSGSGGEDSSEPAPPASKPPPAGEAVLTFPTVGTVKSWPLLRPQVDEWTKAYPGVDVLAECRKALAWVKANPAKTKTARGMPAFLVRWLGNATDSGKGAARSPAKTKADRDQEQLEREFEACHSHLFPGGPE